MSPGRDRRPGPSAPSEPAVAAARHLDTCAISDAMDGLGLDGVVGGLVRLCGGGTVAGRAVTVLLGPAAGGTPPTVHLGTTAVERAGPSDVIVVDNGARTAVAGWGGLLSLAASVRGVRAVFVDGAARDIDQAAAAGLTLWARAPVPTTARTRVVEVATDVAVTLGGVRVQPGDLVTADGSGVVVVPSASVHAVLERARSLAAREDALAAEIRSGRAVSQVMGTAYERMLDEGRRDG